LFHALTTPPPHAPLSTQARKKKALFGLKPSEKDYAAKMTAAQVAVDKADAALNARTSELDKMTAVLKGEMARVSAARSSILSEAIVAFAREQAENARAREAAWKSVVEPLADGDLAAVARSKKDMDELAKRAEARARNQSVAAPATATSTTAAENVGGVSAGGVSGGGTTTFAASGATADDL
jgi:hypothetical protein